MSNKFEDVPTIWKYKYIIFELVTKLKYTME